MDLSRITLDDIRVWLKTQPDHTILGLDPTACFASSAYMRYLFGYPIDEPTCPIEISELQDGICHIHAENSYEFHEFVMELDGNNVKIFQTYGGTPTFQIITHIKTMFLHLICQTSGSSWRQLFNIDDAYMIPEDVGLTKFSQYVYL